MDLEQQPTPTPEIRMPESPKASSENSKLEDLNLEASEDIGFQALESPPPPEPGKQATEEAIKPEPKVIPFSGAEIAGFVGTVVGMVVAAREGWTPEQAAAFNAAYSSGKVGAMLPIPLAQGLALPPAEVLDKLQVGEALATFGIGKPKSLSIESAGDLPPLMRIGLGALMLGAATFGGVLAARSLKAEPETTPAPNPGGDRPDAGGAARA